MYIWFLKVGLCICSIYDLVFINKVKNNSILLFIFDKKRINYRGNLCYLYYIYKLI